MTNIDKQRLADAVSERLLKAKPGSKVSVTADEMEAFLEVERNKLHVQTVGSLVDKTLAERGNRYGDFTYHASIAQGLQFRMQTFCIKQDNLEGFIIPWKHKLNDVQRQALTVIADKIARILSGDPNYADNWHDIQGYAKLVEDRLPKESK